jgi:hypothetical protein
MKLPAVVAAAMMVMDTAATESRNQTTVPQRSSMAESRDRADEVVQQMTVEEKLSFLSGYGWSASSSDRSVFVGNIPPVPRLGIPSLNMMVFITPSLHPL